MGSSTYIQAQLAEFSGNIGSSPLDKTASNSGTGATVVATAGSTNVVSGELVLVAGVSFYSASGTKTISHTVTGAATTITSTNNNSTNLARHYNFGYGVSTTNTSAESDSYAQTTASITGGAVAIASFLLPTTTAITGVGAIASAEAFGAAGITAGPVVQDRSSGVDASGTTSHTLTLPTGIASGDLLVIVAGAMGVGGTILSAVTGFTREDYYQINGASLFTRLADGTEGATVAGTTNNAGSVAYSCYRVSGSAARSWGWARATGTSTTPDPPNAPTSDMGTTDWLFLAMATILGNGSITSYPTNYINGQAAHTTGSVVWAASAERHLNTQYEDPGVFTFPSSNNWVAYTLGIRGPAPATVGAFGIPTAEAFGTVKVTQVIAPTGIASAGAFGTTVVSTTPPQSVTPSGIVSAEAFGTVTVVPPTASVTLSGIATAGTFGTTVVYPVTNILPIGIVSAEAFGTVLVQSATQSVGPIGNIVSGETFGLAIVLNVYQYAELQAIPSEESFGLVNVGRQAIAVSAISSAETFGSTNVRGSIGAGGITSAEAFGQIAVLAQQPLGLTGIATQQAFGLITVAPQYTTVALHSIASNEAFGETQIAYATKYVTGVGAIASTEAFGQVSATRVSGIAIIVNGEDITSYVLIKTLKVENSGGPLLATCTFDVVDTSGSIYSIVPEADVVINEGEQAIFRGTIKTRTRTEIPGEGVVRYTVGCQDLTTLLTDNVITEDRDVFESDRDRIIYWLTTYGTNGITYGGVQTIVSAPVPFVSQVKGMTLYEAINDTCSKTGGSFYVDMNKSLHYFKTEPLYIAPFGLSDTPDGLGTFGYESISLPDDTVTLVNAVYVVGTNIAGWFTDATSIATYGRHEGGLRDTTLITSDDIAAAGQAYLDAHAYPFQPGTVTVHKRGLFAGQTIHITNSLLGLSNEQFTIAKVIAKPFTSSKFSYEVQLTDGIIDLASQHHDADVGHVKLLEASNIASDYAAGLIGRVIVVSFLPSLPDDNYPQGQLVMLASDGKLYRNTTGSTWTAAISGTDIAPNSITSSQIAANSILAGSIAAGAVGADAIAANAVTASKIATHSITATQIAAGAITATEITLGTITAAQIANSTITGTQITAGAISTPNIAAGAITSAVIAAGTITSTQIASQTITGNNIAAQTITATNIAAGTITADKLQAGSITGSQIAAGSITGDKISAGSITGDKISAGSITATDIASQSIQATHIASSGDFTAQWFRGTGGLALHRTSPDSKGTYDSVIYPSRSGGNIIAMDDFLDVSHGGIGVPQVTGTPGVAANGYTSNNGALAVDISSGYIWFRYGGAWHYVVHTAGVTIPDYERTCPVCEDPLLPGDDFIARGDRLMPDGNLHALYVHLQCAGEKMNGKLADDYWAVTHHADLDSSEDVRAAHFDHVRRLTGRNRNG
jgi:hypothetical protein